MAKTEAVSLFRVSLSSLKRYVEMARERRSLAPKKQTCLRPKLDDRARKLLAADLNERPFARLADRSEYLQTMARVR
jgi:transposase